VRQRHPGKRVEVWFQDELRAGQQGTLTRKWAPRGSRPTAVRQTEYKWAYVFASICPATGGSVALIAPTVNTYLMNAHLRHVSEELGPDRHAVLILDGAGWHRSNDLAVPDNVTLLHLPPYSPELNPVERVWRWLRDRKLSNRILPADAEMDALLAEVMTAISPERFKSLCHVDWLETVHDR